MKNNFKILFLCLFCALCGCGFKPLYYKTKTAHNTIFVNPISDFLGQKLRFELRERLSPAGFPKEPKYYLQVSLQKILLEKQALRSDATSTRNTIRMTASFTLSKDNGEVLLKDSVVVRSSYDILNMPYATTASEKSNEENMVTSLAERIALRVDVFLINYEGNSQ